MVGYNTGDPINYVSSGIGLIYNPWYVVQVLPHLSYVIISVPAPGHQAGCSGSSPEIASYPGQLSSLAYLETRALAALPFLSFTNLDRLIIWI